MKKKKKSDHTELPLTYKDSTQSFICEDKGPNAIIYKVFQG